ncbi:sterol 3-beta-glucosyltransferase [Martiniozyma asiatica (nom. inval.)]|nr:sterol 3-beta-glucosyltransferase [Martiniozyma asiatica]
MSKNTSKPNMLTRVISPVLSPIDSVNPLNKINSVLLKSGIKPGKKTLSSVDKDTDKQVVAKITPPLPAESDDSSDAYSDTELDDFIDASTTLDQSRKSLNNRQKKIGFPLKTARTVAKAPKKVLTTISLVPKEFPLDVTKSMLPFYDTKEHKENLGDKENIEGVSKSFVGFLTAASVCAGFQDLENEDEDSVDSHETDQNEGTQNDTSIGVNEKKIPIDILKAINSNNPDLKVKIDEKPNSDANPLDSGTLKTETKTKFELSVQKKLSQYEDESAAKKRVVALCKKLKAEFEISDSEEFVSDYQCWLTGDVLLQGHLYITTGHILFFAFLPKKSEETISKAGSLTIQSSRSLRVHRKWVVLRENTLSIYPNSTELYFPESVIDLRTALRAEIYSKKIDSCDPCWLRLITENRTHWFQADNIHGARAWVTILKKHIFASRNDGNEVSIKIPLQNVIDLELTSIIGVAKTLRIKVIENADTFALDDYFILFFSKGKEAVTEIRNVITNAGVQISNSDAEDDELLESQLLKSKVELIRQSASSVSAANIKHKGIRNKLKDWRDVFSGGESDSDSLSEVEESQDSSEKNKLRSKIKANYLKTKQRVHDSHLKNVQDSTHHSTTVFNGRKPWSTKEVLQSLGTFTQNLITTGPFQHYDEISSMAKEGEDKHFVNEPNERENAKLEFTNNFSLSENTKLIATYFGYLIKGLPTYGKVYISSNALCFKSTLPGSGTLMILPLSDIENISKENGFRFGYSGLVVVIQGHEELFFEFASHEARDDCELQLLKALDNKKKNLNHDDIDAPEELSISTGSLSSAKIRMFENKITDDLGIDVPIIVEDHPLLKTKVKSSEFFKFTLLTIGSRGDVQPYIALGKALLKEGHQVKIVTHIEFKDWILGHGLNFSEIAGDPSELMALMVSHPNINYSFIKEAKLKFRSWIDELLVTSWAACQDTDVLIESPSSIGGIHIAEKLQIPYFRAFTMPWTRTRAYPQAFMVPDQKLGGAYNYMTHVAFENGYWRGTSSQINKWRVETLKLPKTSLAGMRQADIPFLYNMSPIVFPPSVDFSEWVKVTGYWFLNESQDYKPPEELLQFLAKARSENKKVVYIGFGSIVVENPKELTQAVIDAVLEADVYCILNKGWSDRLGSKNGKELEMELPSQVYNSGSIPHDWLFNHMDAAVHHGGSGTTGASLRFGLPTIIKPFFGDQKFYANRVEDMGCGIALKTLNSKSLAKALKEATTNTRIIEKAKLAGQIISKENGVQNAVHAIYSLMDYAKKVSVSKANGSTVDADEIVVIDEDTENDINKNFNSNDEEAKNSNDASWLFV